MQQIVDSEEGVTFRQWTPTWLRVVLFLFGLLTLLAPYELLIRPRFDLAPSPFALVPLLISLGALGIGAVLFRIAWVAPEAELRFDARTRVVTHSGTQGRRFRVSYPFEAIRDLALVAQEWETRDETWRIEVRLDRGMRIQTPDFAELTEAAAMMDRLRAMVRAGDAGS